MSDQPQGEIDQPAVLEQPTGVLRFRSAEQIGVNYKQRIIELVVAPYEEEALVEIKGRMVTEVIARGAYDGIERRANRVRVNRDHQLQRTVGRAISFRPSDERGLVAELRIAKTVLGDETLALAEDDCLDASAGYLPMAGGEKWLTRSSVRITRAFLGHVALTPDPAYAGARVLSVRAQAGAGGPTEPPGQEPEQPNLEIVRGWLLEDRTRQFEAGLRSSGR